MEMNFNEALKYAKNCRIDGYSDWRIPSIQEWLTIMSYKHSKIDISCMNFNAPNYWSSIKHEYLNNNAWSVSLTLGNVNHYNTYSSFYVRCVRGGQYDKLGLLIIHNLQNSEELFTVKQNTVIDNRTSLEWSLM